MSLVSGAMPACRHVSTKPDAMTRNQRPLRLPFSLIGVRTSLKSCAVTSRRGKSLRLRRTSGGDPHRGNVTAVDLSSIRRDGPPATQAHLRHGRSDSPRVSYEVRSRAEARKYVWRQRNCGGLTRDRNSRAGRILAHVQPGRCRHYVASAPRGRRRARVKGDTHVPVQQWLSPVPALPCWGSGESRCLNGRPRCRPSVIAGRCGRVRTGIEPSVMGSIKGKTA